MSGMKINCSKFTARKSSTSNKSLPKILLFYKFFMIVTIPQMDAHALEPKLRLQYKLLTGIILEEKPKPRCVLNSEVCHMLELQRRLGGDEGLNYEIKFVNLI